MTIKVEQEVLLRVLDSRYSSSSLPPLPTAPLPTSIQVNDDDEFLLVDFLRKPLRRRSSTDCASVEKLRNAPYSDNDCTEQIYYYDDCDDETSIFTLSTASISSDDSSSTSSELERRVSFASDLVTDEWTRPYTPKELIPTLFYSIEETARFRREYRMERNLLSGDLTVDLDSCAIDTSSEETSSRASLQQPPSTSTPCSYCLPVLSAARHRISRVVVLHNDKLETFFDGDDIGNNSHDDDHHNFDSDTTSPPTTQEPSATDSFFDNDSFWSGSITWY